MANEDQIENGKKIIDSEITKVILNSSLIESGGCASCHVLFKLVDALSLNESDAGDLLSQVLYENPELNEKIVLLLRLMNEIIDEMNKADSILESLNSDLLIV